MTELEKALLACVEKSEKESREREAKLLQYLKQVEQRTKACEDGLKILTSEYAKVAEHLNSLTEFLKNEER